MLFCKGASEMVLRCCSDWHSAKDDQVHPITADMLKQIEGSITAMAERALRTLVIAYKPVTPTANISVKDNLGVFEIETSGLCLLAVLGVRDIPRPQVPQAIKDCITASIKVRMVTGDNIVTARAIAKEIGIIDPNNPDSLVM